MATRSSLAALSKASRLATHSCIDISAFSRSASDDLVAIYARMQPENAAVQLSAMDDQMAAAILGKLKPSAAGAILDEMEAERASKLASFLSGAKGGEKKS
jgi:flagellar motility protein MotE (MotC chaperone)